MIATNVMNGSAFGHSGASFARVTAIKKLGFNLGRAVVHSLRPNRVAPLEDQRIAAMFKEEAGDVSPTTVIVLDCNALTHAYASAYVLLRKQTRKINPETGRVDEHIVKFLKGPTEAIVAALEFARDGSMAKSIDYAKAECEMLKVDPTARIEAIKAQRAVETKLDITAHETYFLECLKKVALWDEDDLIDDVLEAMTDSGSDPGVEFKRSVKAFMESQAKRASEGKYVKVDPNLYAMSLDVTVVAPLPPVVEVDAATAKANLKAYKALGAKAAREQKKELRALLKLSQATA
jgi:hypothetical protein